MKKILLTVLGMFLCGGAVAAAPELIPASGTTDLASSKESQYITILPWDCDPFPEKSNYTAFSDGLYGDRCARVAAAVASARRYVSDMESLGSVPPVKGSLPCSNIMYRFSNGLFVYEGLLAVMCPGTDKYRDVQSCIENGSQNEAKWESLRLASYSIKSKRYLNSQKYLEDTFVPVMKQTANEIYLECKRFEEEKNFEFKLAKVQDSKVDNSKIYPYLAGIMDLPWYINLPESETKLPWNINITESKPKYTALDLGAIGDDCVFSAAAVANASRFVTDMERLGSVNVDNLSTMDRSTLINSCTVIKERLERATCVGGMLLRNMKSPTENSLMLKQCIKDGNASLSCIKYATESFSSEDCSPDVMREAMDSITRSNDLLENDFLPTLALIVNKGKRSFLTFAEQNNFTFELPKRTSK